MICKNETLNLRNLKIELCSCQCSTYLLEPIVFPGMLEKYQRPVNYGKQLRRHETAAIHLCTHPMVLSSGLPPQTLQVSTSAAIPWPYPGYRHRRGLIPAPATRKGAKIQTQLLLDGCNNFLVHPPVTANVPIWSRCRTAGQDMASSSSRRP